MSRLLNWLISILILQTDTYDTLFFGDNSTQYALPPIMEAIENLLSFINIHSVLNEVAPISLESIQDSSALMMSVHAFAVPDYVIVNNDW